jgi:DNA-binding MarR family transcriptional regulator
MTIEQEIKQVKFRSSFAKAIINVVYTSNWISGQQNEILKPYDLSIQQYNVLRILRGQSPKPISVNAIIERMMDKMSNASRLVDKLLSKDLVIRRECPDDRRAVEIFITEKGLNILSELDESQSEWEKSLHNLDESEALLLSDLLDRLRNSETE